MDDQRFDSLSRALVLQRTRRGALGGIALVLTAGIFPGETTAKRKTRRNRVRAQADDSCVGVTCDECQECVAGSCQQICPAEGEPCGTCGCCLDNGLTCQNEVCLPCVPDCTDRECRLDGCNGFTCGSCQAGQVCADGYCIGACQDDPIWITCRHQRGEVINNCGRPVDCRRCRGIRRLRCRCNSYLPWCR